MKHPTSGADPLRLSDPPKSHYAASEETFFELDQMMHALDMVADLAEGSPADAGTTLESRLYAPIFRTFANLGKRLIADMPHIPARRAA